MLDVLTQYEILGFCRYRSTLVPDCGNSAKLLTPSFFRLARTFARLWQSGCHISGMRSSGAMMIRYSRRCTLHWGLLVNLKRWAWRGTTGALHHPFAQYFEKPLSEPICRISIRIALETPLSNSARMSVRPLNSSKRGVRTLDMRKF